MGFGKIYLDTKMGTMYQIQASTYDQLVKLQTFLKENPDIKHTLMIHPFEPYSNQCNYIPNPEFAGFCGPENLTKDGCISEETAMNAILSYAKYNKLYFDNHIETNYYLQSVLKMNDSFIMIHMIPRHLKTIFTQVF